jgi:uncharacterized membrane protein
MVLLSEALISAGCHFWIQGVVTQVMKLEKQAANAYVVDPVGCEVSLQEGC